MCQVDLAARISLVKRICASLTAAAKRLAESTTAKSHDVFSPVCMFSTTSAGTNMVYVVICPFYCTKAFFFNQKNSKGLSPEEAESKLKCVAEVNT